MIIVADANPIISIIITPGKPLDILFSEELIIIAPAKIWDEIEKNKDVLLSKSGLTLEEFTTFLNILRSQIKTIPESDYQFCRRRAVEICPDPKDVVYFALALAKQCPLWSNEKKLKEQPEVLVYATHDLIQLLNL